MTNYTDQEEAILRQHIMKKRKKRRRRRRMIFLLIILILAGVGFAGYTMIDKTLDMIPKDKLNESKLARSEVDGYTNILLLGVDARNMEDMGDDARTDMMIIASINDDTFDVTLTSIYRDTYFKMGDSKYYDKLTHAYSYGGVEETIESINQAMDLDIDKYMIVNFKGVADAVDQVGGITVDVEDYEIKELNKYTIDTAVTIGRENYNLVEHPGVQKLDGCQAVSYGRIRKGVGDDYKRTERMRTVINALVTEVRKMNPLELRDFLATVFPELKTSMTNSEMLGYMLHYKEIKMNAGEGFPYQVADGYYRGVSYVFPQDLEEDVIKFHKTVFKDKNYKISKDAADISDEIKYRFGR